ncbi:hypothetical protein FHS21_000904 [Phyllobacterium trifolii]|uniref:Uncharacterized protein n=1 Tax=Phyllobacterium trifolii TaxID=300193 RepID=A0A839U1K9_9HYPH|nr:hypothetical protein [Phyllobacterium trifolii]MBB3144508.1 hypothetical protein [Phyllobacterium trifolii]
MDDANRPNATVEMLISFAPHDIVFSPKFGISLEISNNPQTLL